MRILNKLYTRGYVISMLTMSTCFIILRGFYNFVMTLYFTF